MFSKQFFITLFIIYNVSAAEGKSANVVEKEDSRFWDRTLQTSVSMPTSSPVLRVPPTSPPVLRVPPTSRPVLRVPPTSPPVLRVPPTSPPVVRVPPTSPPLVLRVPPTSPPVLRVPPTSSTSIETQPAFPCTDEELALETAEGPWPCCVGMSGTDCKVYIENKAPDLEVVEIIGENEAVTKDYRTDRVRIFVNKSGTCVVVPRRG